LAIVTGNISNTDLIGVIKHNLDQIVSSLEESGFVELEPAD
jgi:predicted nuclease of predicted toxin-antitoxin system